MYRNLTIFIQVEIGSLSPPLLKRFYIFIIDNVSKRIGDSLIFVIKLKTKEANLKLFFMRLGRILFSLKTKRKKHILQSLNVVGIIFQGHIYINSLYTLPNNPPSLPSTN